MKKIVILIVYLLLKFGLKAQLFNNGASLIVSSSGVMQVNGDFTNSAGSDLVVNGILNITGNIINNQTMSTANTGTLAFKGSTQQTLSGSKTYFAKNIVVDNSNGVVIGTPLRVDGVFSFISGIVTSNTIATEVTFTSSASVSTTDLPTDLSHINGYVVNEGIGGFTYPVGDGAKYQPLAITTTTNGSGIRVKYNTSDAGSGAFTSGGSEATALVAYNRLEHWSVAPISTAVGTVTLFWDSYNNVGIANTGHLRVAHKSATTWLNEGGIGTGSVSSGNITSNSISAWGTFALGSINALSPLPVKWISVTGKLNNNSKAVIRFKVVETDVRNYNIEKSTDGIRYELYNSIASKGNGMNEYEYIDGTPINGKVFYRIKQIDSDDRSSYSVVIRLNESSYKGFTIYPNPVYEIATVIGCVPGTELVLTNSSGLVLEKIATTQRVCTINLGNYSSGIYFLQNNKGEVLKIIKK